MGIQLIKAVTESILLVDFDYGVQLTILRVKKFKPLEKKLNAKVSI